MNNSICFLKQALLLLLEEQKNVKNDNNNFSGIIFIIEAAKQRAMKAVNTELINMYWEVGKNLSYRNGKMISKRKIPYGSRWIPSANITHTSSNQCQNNA